MTEEKQNKSEAELLKKFFVGGFAKGNGKVVHIIVDDIYLMCSRERQMTPEEGLSFKDVSCKKCKRLSLFKEMSKELGLSIDKPIEKKKEQKPEKKKKETKQKQKKETNKKPDMNVQQKAFTEIKQSEENENKLNCSTNKQEERQQLMVLANMLASIKGQFSADLKTNLTYRITHVKSNWTFFDNIPKEVVSQALLLLNNMELTWDGKDKPSPGFLSKAKDTLAQAYQLACANYPESLKKKAEEKKEIDKKNKVDEPSEPYSRLPKRREKPKKIKTKLPMRREKRPTLFGKREGTPTYTIAKTISGDIFTKKDLVEKLISEFGFSEEIAKVKFASAIRILTRNCGIPVCIVQNKNEDNDSYTIFKEDEKAA